MYTGERATHVAESERGAILAQFFPLSSYLPNPQKRSKTVKWFVFNVLFRQLDSHKLPAAITDSGSVPDSVPRVTNWMVWTRNHHQGLRSGKFIDKRTWSQIFTSKESHFSWSTHIWMNLRQIFKSSCLCFKIVPDKTLVRRLSSTFFCCCGRALLLCSNLALLWHNSCSLSSGLVFLLFLFRYRNTDKRDHIQAGFAPRHTSQS